jgi:hypothetical protein
MYRKSVHCRSERPSEGQCTENLYIEALQRPLRATCTENLYFTVFFDGLAELQFCSKLPRWTQVSWPIIGPHGYGTTCFDPHRGHCLRSFHLHCACRRGAFSTAVAQLRVHARAGRPLSWPSRLGQVLQSVDAAWRRCAFWQRPNMEERGADVSNGLTRSGFVARDRVGKLRMGPRVPDGKVLMRVGHLRVACATPVAAFLGCRTVTAASPCSRSLRMARGHGARTVYS